MLLEFDSSLTKKTCCYPRNNSLEARSGVYQLMHLFQLKLKLDLLEAACDNGGDRHIIMQ